ncbi:MAG: ATP synthase F1 subunit epsilon [Rhodospirillales bacterium]
MADKVQFEIVTPTRLLVAETADMIVVPGGDGDFGVLPGHTPLLSSIRPGIVDIHEHGKVQARFFIAGGFAEVDPEKCVILADEAAPVGEIDKAAAQARLENAKKSIEGIDEASRKAAEAELARAEAMVAAAEAHAG